MSNGCLSSIVLTLPVLVIVLSRHSYVISSSTRTLIFVVMETLSMTPYL
jgi:hypothetical protein